MKIKRQSKIIEIVRNNAIETQEELAERLGEAGFFATQATISRDIRELKLSKVTTSNNKQKYVFLTATDTEFLDRLYRIFKEAVISIDYAQNLVIIKTLDGMAMAVAASLDGMDKKEIIGTIAGDDTLFCAMKSEADAIKLIEDLNLWRFHRD